jgi:hypothetical protein
MHPGEKARRVKDMATHPEPERQPLTVKDVLKAIFLPPVDRATHERPSLPKPENILPSFGFSGEAYALPLDLNAPAVVTYADEPVGPLDNVSPARLATVGIGTVVAILISYLAQTALSNPASWGTLLAVMAVGVWLSLLMFEMAPPDGGLLRRGPIVSGGGAARPFEALSDQATLIRGVLGGLATVLSVATYIYTENNTFTVAGFISWVLSVLLWMVVVSERSPDQLIADARDWLTTFRISRTALRPRIVPLIAFVIIMGASIFFRTYQLNAIPNEMTSDHVEKVLDAYSVSQGVLNVFFPHNGGREAFQFYFIPLVARLSGIPIDFMVLKIASVLEALALIPLMMLLGREVIDRETGIFAAALLSISWWHTMLARLALRIVLTPLVFTLVLVTLIRGIRTGARRHWIWAGFWMGIGVYCYQALRITPLVAVAAFIITVAGPIWRALRAQLRQQADAPALQTIASNIVARQGLNLLSSGVVALTIFMPMARFWHDYPNDLWNRVINRTTENEIALNGSASEIFADNYVKALRMFNVKGDGSWFSAVPGAPMFDTITGALFILGVVSWLVRLRVRRDPVDTFILIAGLVMLLPSALAIAFPAENPSTTRASGTIPVVFLIAAWPLALIRQRWSAVLGRIIGAALAALLIGMLLVASATLNYDLYFSNYAQSYRGGALNPGEVAAAVQEVIGENASLNGVWLQGWPFWHDYRAIGIEAGDYAFHNAILDVPMLQQMLVEDSDKFEARPLVFILHPMDEGALVSLQDHFPDGSPTYYDSQLENRDFVLFIVPE